MAPNDTNPEQIDSKEKIMSYATMTKETTTESGSLHVAELAERAGVSPATIRYYARIDLLSPSREPQNGYRRFSIADLRRVEFIRRAQGLGLTISDIKLLFDAISQGEVPCHKVKDLVQQRLHSIQERIAELRATELRMSQALETWRQMEHQPPQKGEFCPLIERLQLEECGNGSR